MPEWSGDTSVAATFRRITGIDRTVTFEYPAYADAEPVSAPTSIALPATDTSDIAYTFADRDSQTVLLKVASLMRYREAFKDLFSQDMSDAWNYTAEAHQHFHTEPVPQDTTTLRLGIPSAAETIAALLEDMKRTGASNIIVDLRDNTGGNSAR